MSKSKSKTRRTFTREFKVRAVQLVTEKGYSYAEAARQLGIAEAQLRNWKKQLDASSTQAFPGNGNAIEEEVQRLRAENKRLLLERDILKKATAFFAKECP
jgi:transposase